jgi:hypothetical protein
VKLKCYENSSETEARENTMPTFSEMAEGNEEIIRKTHQSVQRRRNHEIKKVTLWLARKEERRKCQRKK